MRKKRGRNSKKGDLRLKWLCGDNYGVLRVKKCERKHFEGRFGAVGKPCDKALIG